MTYNVFGGTLNPTQSINLVHPAVWPQYTWAEKWAGVLCPFQGELGLRLRQCGLG